MTDALELIADNKVFSLSWRSVVDLPSIAGGSHRVKVGWFVVGFLRTRLKWVNVGLLLIFL